MAMKVSAPDGVKVRAPRSGGGDGGSKRRAAATCTRCLHRCTPAPTLAPPPLSINNNNINTPTHTHIHTNKT